MAKPAAIKKASRLATSTRPLLKPYLICDLISGQSDSFLLQAVAYGYSLDHKTTSSLLKVVPGGYFDCKGISYDSQIGF